MYEKHVSHTMKLYDNQFSTNETSKIFVSKFSVSTETLTKDFFS